MNYYYPEQIFTDIADAIRDKYGIGGESPSIPSGAQRYFDSNYKVMIEDADALIELIPTGEAGSFISLRGGILEMYGGALT